MKRKNIHLNDYDRVIVTTKSGCFVEITKIRFLR